MARSSPQRSPCCKGRTQPTSFLSKRLLRASWGVVAGRLDSATAPGNGSDGAYGRGRAINQVVAMRQIDQKGQSTHSVAEPSVCSGRTVTAVNTIALPTKPSTPIAKSQLLRLCLLFFMGGSFPPGPWQRTNLSKLRGKGRHTATSSTQALHPAPVGRDQEGHCHAGALQRHNLPCSPLLPSMGGRPVVECPIEPCVRALNMWMSSAPPGMPKVRPVST